MPLCSSVARYRHRNGLIDVETDEEHTTSRAAWHEHAPSDKKRSGESRLCLTAEIQAASFGGDVPSWRSSSDVAGGFMLPGCEERHRGRVVVCLPRGSMESSGRPRTRRKVQLDGCLPFVFICSFATSQASIARVPALARGEVWRWQTNSRCFAFLQTRPSKIVAPPQFAAASRVPMPGVLVAQPRLLSLSSGQGAAPSLGRRR